MVRRRRRPVKKRLSGRQTYYRWRKGEYGGLLKWIRRNAYRNWSLENEDLKCLVSELSLWRLWC